MIGNKQIIEAQHLLRKLEGAPVRLSVENGDNYWQVTYDDSTYRSLVDLVVAVSQLPIKESPVIRDTYYESISDYHRDKI